MTTKVKSSRTSKSAHRVNSSAINVDSINVSAPVGGLNAGCAGVSIGVVSGGNGVGVAHANDGAVGAAAPAKIRQKSGDQLQAAVARECEDLKVSALRGRIAAHFALPEWAGAAALRAALAPLVESGVMSVEQYEATLAAAARKAGVVAPVCSVARVLAVVRMYYAKEFANVLGCSLDVVRGWLRGGLSAGCYSLVLPLGLVKADSDSRAFLACSALAPDCSASAVVSAVLSLRFVAQFNAARAAARAAALSQYNDYLQMAVRAGLALGLSVEDMISDFSAAATYVPENDGRDEKRLRKSLAANAASINAVNDSILLAGGAGGADVSAKVNKLIAKRARLRSVEATLLGLLAAC